MARKEITDEEFERIWAHHEKRQAEREAEWNSLSEEEKNRRIKEQQALLDADPNFFARMTDPLFEDD